MQIPSRCSIADDLCWGVAALAAAALCLMVVPLLPVAYIAGRWVRGADR